ncbi:MAG: hypothetical protein A2017_18215 [Lentisphaerae bacterium GWF2_44_16]|nr:MAG: hypothetical protein A2017_18215 [Lentisphaerae bacterium GWF2_44_16]
MSKVEVLERVFEFNGVRLPDPGPDLTVDEVKNHYAQVYPELTNSAAKGPVTEKNKQVYSFNHSTGTKG